MSNDDREDRDGTGLGYEHEQWLTFWQRRLSGVRASLKEAHAKVEETNDLISAEPDPTKKLILMESSSKHLTSVTELIAELATAQAELEKAIENNRGSN